MIDQQKEKVIQEVAKSYHSLLRKNNFFPDYNQELEFYEDVSNACVSEHSPWEKFILATETAYFAMPYHLRKIVKLEYFYDNNSFWWEEFCYTKKQYDQFKKEAVDIFYNNLEKTKALEIMKGLKESTYYLEANVDYIPTPLDDYCKQFNIAVKEDKEGNQVVGYYLSGSEENFTKFLNKQPHLEPSIEFIKDAKIKAAEEQIKQKDEKIAKELEEPKKGGYRLLGNNHYVEAYSNYQNAKKRAKELGLNEAEYGDVYGTKVAYCVWNKSGDRNQDEDIVSYYKFGENGKPKQFVTETDIAEIASAAQLKESDFNDYDEVERFEKELDENEEMEL